MGEFINNKQLSLSQRIKIEELLNERKRKFEIANELDKTPSTIAREINKHRTLKPHNIYKSENLFNCKYFINCKVCTDKCRIYQPISCKDRDRNIGACNNCSKLKTCNLDKYFYFAEKAQEQYKYTLTDARQGVNLNTSELLSISISNTSPRIKCITDPLILCTLPPCHSSTGYLYNLSKFS